MAKDLKQSRSILDTTQRIWRYHQRGFLLISLASSVAGATLLVGADAITDHTNRVEFCISCHEMESTVYQEYRGTAHYSNRTGVRVGCSDCHVPQQALAKMARKIGAVKDIYGHLLGRIDTREKFENHRLQMAQQVWQYMEESDSRECRSCHSFEAMDLEKQGRRPQRKHPIAMQQGDTCIDCHKGIAHRLPEGYDLEDDG